MSRSQSTSVYNTATDNSAEQQKQAAESYKKTQEAVGNYNDALSKYAAGNPFGMGGTYQTAQNTSLTNTADSLARAQGQQLQEQAERTGENRSGAVAATEEMNQQTQRDLAAQEADANADRIGKDAAYRGQVVQAGAVPIQAEGNLSGQQGNLALANLSAASQAAAANKSFWDQFGGAFAGGLGTLASGGNSQADSAALKALGMG